jgi:hypothetical protein
MPLGVVTDEQFDSELLRRNDIAKQDKLSKEIEGLLAEEAELVHDPIEEDSRLIKHGRGAKEETPQMIREFIGTEMACGASADLLAEKFGVSKSSVTAYANGATSTSSYNKPQPELKKAIDEVRERVNGTAQQKLMEALHAIDLTNKIRPNVASAVAKDMSAIMRNMREDINQSKIVVNQNRVVIFKPRMKEEDDYEILEVSE